MKVEKGCINMDKGPFINHVVKILNIFDPLRGYFYQKRLMLKNCHLFDPPPSPLNCSRGLRMSLNDDVKTKLLALNEII